MENAGPRVLMCCSCDKSEQSYAELKDGCEVGIHTTSFIKHLSPHKTVDTLLNEVTKDVQSVSKTLQHPVWRSTVLDYGKTTIASWLEKVDRFIYINPAPDGAEAAQAFYKQIEPYLTQRPTPIVIITGTVEGWNCLPAQPEHMDIYIQNLFCDTNNCFMFMEGHSVLVEDNGEMDGQGAMLTIGSSGQGMRDTAIEEALKKMKTGTHLFMCDSCSAAEYIGDESADPGVPVNVVPDGLRGRGVLAAVNTVRLGLKFIKGMRTTSTFGVAGAWAGQLMSMCSYEGMLMFLGAITAVGLLPLALAGLQVIRLNRSIALFVSALPAVLSAWAFTFYQSGKMGLFGEWITANSCLAVMGGSVLISLATLLITVMLFFPRMQRLLGVEHSKRRAIGVLLGILGMYRASSDLYFTGMGDSVPQTLAFEGHTVHYNLVQLRNGTLNGVEVTNMRVCCFKQTKSRLSYVLDARRNFTYRTSAFTLTCDFDYFIALSRELSKKGGIKAWTIGNFTLDKQQMETQAERLLGMMGGKTSESVMERLGHALDAQAREEENAEPEMLIAGFEGWWTEYAWLGNMVAEWLICWLGKLCPLMG